jgi:hypothetical protein
MVTSATEIVPSADNVFGSSSTLGSPSRLSATIHTSWFWRPSLWVKKSRSPLAIGGLTRAKLHTCSSRSAISSRLFASASHAFVTRFWASIQVRVAGASGSSSQR